jgi:hypothetical protein
LIDNAGFFPSQSLARSAKRALHWIAPKPAHRVVQGWNNRAILPSLYFVSYQRPAVQAEHPAVRDIDELEHLHRRQCVIIPGCQIEEAIGNDATVVHAYLHFSCDGRDPTRPSSQQYMETLFHAHNSLFHAISPVLTASIAHLCDWPKKKPPKRVEWRYAGYASWHNLH